MIWFCGEADGGGGGLTAVGGGIVVDGEGLGV